VRLEPYPDVLVEQLTDATAGPEARYGPREALALPFVAGLQHLPAGERATLLLRDVAGFSTPEVAAMLDSSEWAVSGVLQRARAKLRARPHAKGGRPPAPRSRSERALAVRFAAAFERGDAGAIGGLLTEDAFLMMPPWPLERRGPDAIAAFLAEQFETRRGRRVSLLWTRANGQPAFGHYIEDAPSCRALGVIALTLEEQRISGLTRFADLAVLPRMGLPRSLAYRN
jgi:RNA polymerase sigma-70 factor (ECF subfamily)